jgi:hypothetical protein
MRVAHFDQVPWIGQALIHRDSSMSMKFLLEGKVGPPNNYVLAMANYTGGSPPSQAIRIVFVVDGEGRCNNERWAKYFGIEIGAGEAPSFETASGATFLIMSLPVIARASAVQHHVAA